MSDKTFDEDHEASAEKSKKRKHIPLSVPIPVGITVIPYPVSPGASIRYTVSKNDGSTLGKLNVVLASYPDDGNIPPSYQSYQPTVNAPYAALTFSLTANWPPSGSLSVIVTAINTAGTNLPFGMSAVPVTIPAEAISGEEL